MMHLRLCAAAVAVAIGAGFAVWYVLDGLYFGGAAALTAGIGAAAFVLAPDHYRAILKIAGVIGALSTACEMFPRDVGHIDSAAQASLAILDRIYAQGDLSEEDVKALTDCVLAAEERRLHLVQDAWVALQNPVLAPFLDAANAHSRVDARRCPVAQ